jgi:hypothetical protein
VTVCVVPSWFVQHTVAPGATVTDDGEKTKPLIETSVSPDWQGPGAAVPPTTTVRPTHAAQQVDRKATAFINRYYVRGASLVWSSEASRSGWRNVRPRA